MISLLDKVRGCMIGGAVGDAMGFPTEGMHYTRIQKKYGKVTAPMTREDMDWADPPVNGPVYTDDTVMKHMVCQAIFDADGRPTIDHIADVWRRTILIHNQWVWWQNTQTVAMKLQMNPWIELHDIGRDSIACNDAAMIIGPLGIINAGDPFRASMEGWEISSLWQNGYSRECGAAMAACHAEAMRQSATIESIIETARKYSPTMKPYIDKAMDVVSNSKDADDFTERYYATCLEFPNQDFWTSIGPKDPEKQWSFGADPLEVCTEALAFFALSKGNAKEAIIGAINFGRDCDTISGIAAAMCGAINGPEIIPLEWRNTIVEANPEVDMEDYSKKLYDLIIKNLNEIKANAEDILKA